jgi:hypothetical protein
LKHDEPLDPVISAAKAAHSTWFAITRVSLAETMAMARHLLKLNEAVAAIAGACNDAKASGGLLDPTALHAFLTDNELISQETPHEQPDTAAAS